MTRTQDSIRLERLSPTICDWSEPFNPSLIRRGVFYTSVSFDSIRRFFKLWTPEKIFVGIGPRLFFGRSDGPWIPWDRDARDQNLDCDVREREYPWNWGDELWLSGSWDEQPVAMHLCPDDENEVFLGRTGDDLRIEDWARLAAGEHLHAVPLAHFYRGKL